MLVLSDMSCLVNSMAIKGSQLSVSSREKWLNVAVIDPDRQGSNHACNLQGDVGIQISLLWYAAHINTEILPTVVVLLLTSLRHGCGLL